MVSVKCRSREDLPIKAGEFYVHSYYDPETFIRGRILALIDYINRMQAK